MTQTNLAHVFAPSRLFRILFLMSDKQVHIQDSTFQAWMSFSLSDLENAEVEKHLEECLECARRLEQIESPADSLVLRLREMQHSSQSDLRDPRSDSNLLFGTLALQANLISQQQFLDACMLWSSRPAMTLAEVLAQQGWLSVVDQQIVQQLLDQRFSDRGSAESVKSPLKETLVATGLGTVTLPPLAAEKIQLENIHSTGGIGQIWRAHDNILGREIALKELLPEKAGSPANRERFFREARITAQLTHPGTPPIYEYVEEDGRCWYTMKFIHGQTLTEVIAQYHLEKSRREDVLAQLIQLLNYFVTICNTIAYAHSKKILHRDLKSENVLVGDFGEVILLDWGLAKKLTDQSTIEPARDPRDSISPSPSTDPRATLQGERLGTPSFMAPEQAQGLIDRIDYRTDVYGLAAMLYEILTSQPPFVGQDIWQVMHSVEHDLPRPPRELVSDVPPELADICLQGLSKNQNDRQQSAKEISEAVQHWIVEQAQRRRTAEERQLFFNLSSNLLVIHNPEFRLLQTNPAWETILGWTREDLEEMIVWDIIHPDEHAIARQRREHILAGNPMSKLDHRCLCKEGSYKWIRWSTTLIKEEEVVYSVGYDISELKDLERRLAGLPRTKDA